MTDEAVESIIEYADDIGDAEPPPPLPPQEYPFTIVGAEATVSNAGNKYVAAALRISSDDFPADYEAEDGVDGMTLYYRRISLEDTQAGRYSLRRFCEAVGAPMGRRIDLSEWHGLTGRVTTVIETYEGVPRTVAKSVSADA